MIRASIRASVDLPEPLSPTTAVTDERASADRHVLHRVHNAAAAQAVPHLEQLGQVPRLQGRRVRAGRLAGDGVARVSVMRSRRLRSPPAP